MALAEGQHVIERELLPERGEIYAHESYDSDELYPLAMNKKYAWVYAVPRELGDKEEAAKKITEVFCEGEEIVIDDEADVEALVEMDKAELIELVKDRKSCEEQETELLLAFQDDEDPFMPIKRKVDEEIVDEIKAFNLSGIRFSEEIYRFYPENNISSHILGFYGFIDDQLQGQYGLEGYFNEELAGQIGSLKAERDSFGSWITVGERLLEPAVDGADYVLTIDRNIQYFACSKLNEAVLKHGADGGSVIIIEPQTGAIKAMCGSPDFDPNNYNEVEDIGVYINPATYYIYEPGSIFKAITMAAGLDTGVVAPNSTYTDTGEVQVGKYTIMNSDEKSYGLQTMTNVLEKSLNTGAVHVATLVGRERMYDYLKRFNFGEATGIRLNSEAHGDISNLLQQSEVYLATAAFGQGLTTSPLQMTSAYQVLANKGKLMKPYIIEEIRYPDDTVEKISPQEIRQVITSKSATTLGAMMVSVVENGHGGRAGVKGYYVAGKTGTAQIPAENGRGYDPNRNIGSFGGWAPVDNPVFVMLTKIDVPRDVEWAESSAAPLFGEIAEFLLNYYQVPPERET